MNHVLTLGTLSLGSFFVRRFSVLDDKGPLALTLGSTLLFVEQVKDWQASLRLRHCW